MARSYTPRYNGPITIEAIAPEPEHRIKRNSGTDLSQQIEVLTKSRAQADEKGMGLVFGMNVNTEAVSTLESRFRNAAKELGVGVSFEQIPSGDRRVNPAWGLTPGHVRLLVQARPKRDVTPPQNRPAKAAPAKKAAGARR